MQNQFVAIITFLIRTCRRQLFVDFSTTAGTRLDIPGVSDGRTSAREYRLPIRDLSIATTKAVTSRRLKIHPF